MAEVVRVFAVGDSVISTCPLVSPPVELNGVGLELAKGYCGIVVAVRPGYCSKPYEVIFDVGDRAQVAIDVDATQIGKVTAPDAELRTPVSPEVPPLDVCEPDRQINHRALHPSSVQYPDRDCIILHKINFAIMCLMYLVNLVQYTKPVAVITVLVLLGAYGNHLQNYGTWSWRPAIFRHDEPTEDEQVVVNPRWVEISRRFDIAFMMTGLPFVSYAIGVQAGQVPSIFNVYACLCILTTGSWVIKFAAHDKAVQIYPR